MYCHILGISIPSGYRIGGLHPEHGRHSYEPASKHGDKVFHPNKREWGLAKFLALEKTGLTFLCGCGNEQLSTNT